MAVSNKRLIEIRKCLAEYGIDETYKKFDIEKATIKRYLRTYRQRNLDAVGSELNKPNVLILDIETSLMLAYTFRIHNTYISPEDICKDSFIISYSYMWLFDDVEPTLEVITPKEAVMCNNNDKRIISNIWQLLEDADVVITHNGKKFDHKRINAKLIEYGHNKPSSFNMIDTLSEIKKVAKFSSHKLDFLVRKLSSRHKEHTSKQLWKDCGKGKQEALDKMGSYNKNDVVILKALYEHCKHWFKSHPTMGLYVGVEGACPICMKEDYSRVSSYFTNVSQYPEYRCNNCGALFRGKSREVGTDFRSTAK